jgi:hypothetical protein
MHNVFFRYFGTKPQTVLTGLIQLCLLVLLFFLPFQTRYMYDWAYIHGAFWEYGTKSLYATELLIWILILLSLAKCYFERQRMRVLCTKNFLKRNLLQFCAPLVGFALIGTSIIMSLNISLSYSFVFHFLEGTSLISVFIISNLSFKKAATVLWFGGVVQAILAFVQFCTQNIVANKWLGMAQHLPSDLGAAVIETGGHAGRWLRAYGSFGWPNSLGIYLAIIFVIGLLLYIQSDVKYRIFFLLGQIMVLTGLVLTFSRAALIAVVVGSAVYTFFILKNKKESRSALCIHFTCCFISCVSFAFILHPFFSARITTNSRLEQRSVQERVGQYTEVFQVLKIPRYFFIGVGPGAYTAYLHATYPEKKVWELQPVHNVALLSLVETGVLFFCFLALIFGYFFYYVVRKDAEYVGVVVVLVVTGMFDHWVWSLYGGQLVCFAVIGLGFLKIRSQQNTAFK